MDGLQYRDLVIVASDVEKGEDGSLQKFSVKVFDSPVGQGRVKEWITLPAGIREELQALENKLLDFNVKRQVRLGLLLGNMLLPTGARELYHRSVASLHPGEGLRLRLRLDDELGVFPWEFLCISDSPDLPTGPPLYLALQPRISIVRHEALPVPGDWPDAPGKRTVVVAAASPGPRDRYPELKRLAVERELIRKHLSRVPGIDAKLLPYEPQREGSEGVGTTAHDLVESLLGDHPADVFHFMGHGGFDPTTGQGQLILADKRNIAVPLNAERLAEMLQQRGIRLAVLDACQTGSRGGRDVWSGVAAALLRVGIPTVVAIQYTIGDGPAAVFSVALYQALLAGRTIDEAVFQGRAAMRALAVEAAPDIRDWGAPVLYLRSPHGIVFNPISDKDAVAKAEGAAGHLVEQHLETVKADGRMIGLVSEDLKEPVKVVQEVQQVEGFVVGGIAFESRGGVLSIKQTAKEVGSGGILIGQVIGGKPSTKRSSESATESLIKLLLGDHGT